MGMIDREKVIKGLDVCLKNIDRPDCPNDCPYLSDCLKYENRVVFQPLMRDALALLKEQDAKNVVDMRLSKDWFRIASCPRCNELLNWVYHRKNCGYCGQAVKWE